MRVKESARLVKKARALGVRETRGKARRGASALRARLAGRLEVMHVTSLPEVLLTACA